MLTITIINDCRDANAMARQAIRVASLFKEGHIETVGVNSDLEAAGHLVDAIDASSIQIREKGLVLVNVAPRGGAAKKYPNGSPFGYFYRRKVLVLATVDGFTLSLAKKLGILPSFHVMDVPTVTKAMVRCGIISRAEARRANNSQFRSFDFLPYAALCLLERFIPDYISDAVGPGAVPDPPRAVWFIDNFGNAKTTLLPEDIDLLYGETIEINSHHLHGYQHLSDVPDGEAALIIGSSGIGDKRFVEIVIGGRGSAAEVLGLKVGQVIL